MSLRCEHLAVLLRVHRRPQYLTQIFKQIKQLSDGRSTTVLVRTDRPSMEVMTSLDRIQESLPSNIKVEVFEAACRTRSSSGENWALSCVELHEKTLALEPLPEVAMLWDDDVVFGDTALQEVKEALAFFDYDNISVRWAMCHGSTNIENTTFPAHWAACAFRVYKDDAWSTTLVQHAPANAANGTTLKLSPPALHLGYLTENDREEAWLAAKASGKLDNHTYALIRPPQLKEL